MSLKMPFGALEPFFSPREVAAAACGLLRSSDALGHQRGVICYSERESAENPKVPLCRAPRLLDLKGMTLGNMMNRLLVQAGAFMGRLLWSSARAT